MTDEFVPPTAVPGVVPCTSPTGSATGSARLRLVSTRPTSPELAFPPGSSGPSHLLCPCWTPCSGRRNPGGKQHLLVLDRLTCGVRPPFEPILKIVEHVAWPAGRSGGQGERAELAPAHGPPDVRQALIPPGPPSTTAPAAPPRTARSSGLTPHRPPSKGRWPPCRLPRRRSSRRPRWRHCRRNPLAR